MSTTPAHSIRYLVLWLTTGCNLSCAYCYRGDPPVRTMSPEVARKALGLAASSGRAFHVQMAGGEPTLAPEIMEAVGRIVREARWPATLAVQTNGTLIDSALIDLCRRYSISIGISLDGPPEVQDRIRGNARNTFRGLVALSRAETPVRVTTVLSSLNVSELGRLILSLAAFPNIEGIAVDPVVLKGRALMRDELVPSESALRRGVGDMLSTLDEVNRRRSRPIRWRELDAVRGALEVGAKPGDYCHACGGECLAVVPDGTVYPCGQTAGDPAMKAGTVDGVDRERLKDAFRKDRPREECLECALRGRCPGDCPSRLLYNAKHTSRAMCIIYREIVECLERISRS